MLQRILEPEIGSGEAEAWLYHDMDHRAANEGFVADLLAGGQVGPRVMDLGCGPGAIGVAICQTDPAIEYLGLDLDIEMLEIARREIDMAGMLDRMSLQLADAKKLEPFDRGMADTVVSNSLAHHLPQPGQLIESALHLVGDRGRIFIRDLVRPSDSDAVEELVQQYAGNEAEAAAQLFRQSLFASLTIDEIGDLLAGYGIDRKHVQMSSDRHWTIDCEVTGG